MTTARTSDHARSPRRAPICCLLALLMIITTAVGAIPTSRSAQAQEPRKLETVPALNQWSPEAGTFQLSDRSSIQYGARQLRTTAGTFAEDLRAQDPDRQVRVRPAGRTARSGDIVIDLDQGATDLGPEGYRLDVSDVIRVTAQTDDGVFHATRTLLQALANGDEIPYGQGEDQPTYQDRGVAICPCALKVSLPWIERLIKEMSYLKLRYLLVPLKVKSDAHPEINQWAYYTKDEAREIARVAEKYHVTVIPEVNAPGHMEPFLFDREDLQLTDIDGVRSPGRIDITQPAALEFYTALIDEYVEIFDPPEWHLGADEYMLWSAYDHYPQIKKYAQKLYGQNAEPEDAFIHFVNQVDDHLRQKHDMKLRIWNDGLPRRNTVDVTDDHPRLNRDITVEHWTPGHVSPTDLLDAGYAVTNAASSLYEDSGGRVSGHDLCPTAGRLEGCLPELWESGWDPTRFEGGASAPDNSPPTGAHLSLWQSVPSAETENMLEGRLSTALRVLAQRTWDPTGTPDLSYADFVQRAERVGHAPGWTETEQRRPLNDGTYSLGSGDGLLAAETEEPNSRLRWGSDPTIWHLTGTDDGYYTMRSPTTGLCAAMPDAPIDKLLAEQPGVGALATMQACHPADQLQKWQIDRRSDGGFTITNAIHQMPTTASADEELTQRPPDQQSATDWRIRLEHPATLDVASTAEMLKAGEANQVTVTFTNQGTEPMSDVAARLPVLGGWTVDPDHLSWGDVAPGESVTATFAVTPSSDASTQAPVTLTATATYDQDQSIRGSVHTRVDPISCGNPDDPPPSPDDDFDGVALNGCRWSAVKDPDLSALQLDESQLKIDTGPDDLVGQTGTSITNLLLQPAQQDDVTVELEMHAPLKERYQQSGLIFHQDDDNYVEMVLVADNAPGEESRLYLSLVSEQDGQFRKGGAVNVFDVPPSSDDQWSLRLIKQGTEYTAAYSTDGEAWTEMPGSVVNTKITKPSIGLFAAGPGQTEPTTVAFDAFRVR